MKTGLFCGTFGVFRFPKKLRFGLESNNETPKNNPEEGLTLLAPPQIILWSFNIAF